MIRRFLDFFGLTTFTSNDEVDTRRQDIRHSLGSAEIIWGNRVYSMQDWSFGGVAFDLVAGQTVQVGEEANMLLKFHFPHKTITIQQPAKILRAVNRSAAAKFLSVPKETHKQFREVLDSLYAQIFLESQIA